MAVLQVKDMDDGLYAALRDMAKREYRSISQEVISILEQYINSNKTLQNSTVEFLKLSGSWQDSRTPEEINKDIKSARTQGSRRFKHAVFD